MEFEWLKVLAEQHKQKKNQERKERQELRTEITDQEKESIEKWLNIFQRSIRPFFKQAEYGLRAVGISFRAVQASGSKPGFINYPRGISLAIYPIGSETSMDFSFSFDDMNNVGEIAQSGAPSEQIRLEDISNEILSDRFREFMERILDH